MPPFRYEAPPVAQPYRSPYTAAIADAIGNQGQARARMWQNLAQQGTNTLADWVQYQREAPKRQLQALQVQDQQQQMADDRALRQAYQQANGDPNQMRQILSARGGMTLKNDVLLNQLTEHKQSQDAEATSKIGRWVHTQGNTPEALQGAFDAAEKAGLMTADDVQRMATVANSDPAKIPQLSAQMIASTKDGAEWLKSQTPKPDASYTLSPGQSRYGANNEVVASVPAAEKPPPAEKGLQTEKFRLNGRDVMGVFNPTTGQYLYQGQDVTGNASPIPAASIQINAANAAAGASGDVSPVAKSIAEYRTPPPSPRSVASGAGKALMEQVLRANPSYDATQFPTRQKMRITFTSGPQSQAINSLNTAIGHLDQFVDVAKALDNGNFRPGNDAYNWLRTTFGDSAPTNFNGIKSIMAGELASAFKKSGATDQEIASVESAISSSASGKQLIDYATKIAIPALGSKVASYNAQYQQVMGKEDPYKILSPDAEAVLTKHGFDPAHPTMGNKLAAAGAGRVRVVGPNGQTGTVPSGTALPAGWKLQ